MTSLPLKPSIGDTANPQGGKIGRLTTNDFTIIVQRMRPRYSLHRWGEDTGAGDTDPVLGHNRMLRGMITFQGIMVEGEIGIANMVDPAKNPATGVEIILSSGRKQTVNLMFTDVWWDHDVKGPNVPIVFTAHVTSTSPANIEGTVGGGG